MVGLAEGLLVLAKGFEGVGFRIESLGFRVCRVRV